LTINALANINTGISGLPCLPLTGSAENSRGTSGRIVAHGADAGMSGTPNGKRLPRKNCGGRMSDKARRAAELTMLYILPDIVQAKPGRLKNRLDKMSDFARQEINRLDLLPSENMVRHNKSYGFFEVAGWLDKRKHVVTYMAFLSELFAGRYPKIHQSLREVRDYFERAGDLKQACFGGGMVAMEKWEKLWEETNDKIRTDKKTD
jgi:hypothetical protein